MDPLQKIERTSTAPDDIQDQEDKEGTFGSVSWLCVKGAELQSHVSNPSKEVPALNENDTDMDLGKRLASECGQYLSLLSVFNRKLSDQKLSLMMQTLD